MSEKLDYRLALPGIFIVATSYGLARYAYGLFLPIFREAFQLSDAALAYIAAISYGSYFIVTIAGIGLSTLLSPRISVLLGGLAASFGMGLMALAPSPFILAVGVAIAGVSPGLAYTPFSEIIKTLVSEPRQRNIYSIINSGTSLGVMLSAPVAILLGSQWRMAWGLFALFGLVSTFWCVAVLPKLPARSAALSLHGINLRTLLQAGRTHLFAASFLIGIATSIYWAFSVALITSGVGDAAEVARFGQIFWMLVGLAGFAGVFAGSIVGRMGMMRAMRIFVLAIAVGTASLALSQSGPVILASGLLFGASFVLMAATLGMWSLELFEELPAVGFGLAFLLLSAGQFLGPLLVGLLVGLVPLKLLFLLSAGLCGALVFALPAGAKLTPSARPTFHPHK